MGYGTYGSARSGKESVDSMTLKELVIIRNLWDFYFNGEYSSDAIKLICNQINGKTKITQHKNILNIPKKLFKISKNNNLKVTSPLLVLLMA